MCCACTGNTVKLATWAQVRNESKRPEKRIEISSAQPMAASQSVHGPIPGPSGQTQAPSACAFWLSEPLKCPSSPERTASVTHSERLPLSPLLSTLTAISKVLAAFVVHKRMAEGRHQSATQLALHRHQALPGRLRPAQPRIRELEYPLPKAWERLCSMTKAERCRLRKVAGGVLRDARCCWPVVEQRMITPDASTRSHQQEIGFGAETSPRTRHEKIVAMSSPMPRVFGRSRGRVARDSRNCPTQAKVPVSVFASTGELGTCSSRSSHTGWESLEHASQKPRGWHHNVCDHLCAYQCACALGAEAKRRPT